MDINHVVLVGRLTRDAELKSLDSGTVVGRLSIAVNYRKKSGDGYTDAVSFFDAEVWGKLAESLKQYLVKGKQIGIAGELRQEVWSKDGEKRSRVKIVVSDLQLLGSKAESGNKQEYKSYPDTDDIPF